MAIDIVDIVELTSLSFFNNKHFQEVLDFANKTFFDFQLSWSVFASFSK